MTEQTRASFAPQHILCPVDGSDHAALALKYAAGEPSTGRTEEPR